MKKRLPRNWKEIPLGKLISQKNERYRSDIPNIAVLSITNEEGFVKSEEFFKKQVFSKDITGYKIVRKGDLAYNPSRINVGSIALLSKFEITAVSPIYEVFKPNEDVIGKYLLSFLKSKRGLSLIKHYCEGSVRDNLKFSGLSKISIPLPPLSTQYKIVEILEEADNLRKLRQKADEKMKKLIPSLFTEMFGDPVMNQKGWEVKKLKDIVVCIKNGIFKRPSEFGSGVPLINVVDLYSGHKVNNSMLERVSVTQDELEKYLVQDGDLFFCRSSLKKEGVAKCAIVINISEPTVFECHTIMVRLDEKIVNQLFSSIYLNLAKVRAFMVNRSQTATMTTIGQREILKLTIIVPPLPLQQEFATRVEEIEAEKERQVESKKKLDELFNSLMQRAFRGELVA